MSIDQLKQSIQQLPPQLWQELFAWVISDERIRREQEPTKAEVIQQLQDAGMIPAPDFSTTEDTTAPEWVNPGTDHTRMYPEGAVVIHNDKTWVSVTSNLNSWEPGTENGLTWQELTPEDAEAGVPEFVQPTGAHDTYAKGYQVMFEAAVYESLIDNNAYSPTAYPAGWKKINQE